MIIDKNVLFTAPVVAHRGDEVFFSRGYPSGRAIPIKVCNIEELVFSTPYTQVYHIPAGWKLMAWIKPFVHSWKKEWFDDERRLKASLLMVINIQDAETVTVPYGLAGGRINLLNALDGDEVSEVVFNYDKKFELAKTESAVLHTIEVSGICKKWKFPKRWYYDARSEDTIVDLDDKYPDSHDVYAELAFADFLKTEAFEMLEDLGFPVSWKDFLGYARVARGLVFFEFESELARFKKAMSPSASPHSPELLYNIL